MVEYFIYTEEVGSSNLSLPIEEEIDLNRDGRKEEKKEKMKTYTESIRKTYQVLPEGEMVLIAEGDEVTLVVDVKNLYRLMLILRDHSGFQFKVLTEITAVD